MTPPESNLDPQDWGAFRAAAHKLLDDCITRLEAARQHPWEPVPEKQITRYRLDGKENGLAATALRMAEEILPYATGNTHPRFFGWVHGTGNVAGLLAEMVAATMNSNTGGRDHGMNYIERTVIDWTRNVMGFPADASGVLVTGTSQATVLALACARQSVLPDVRRIGMGDTPLAVYAGEGVHNATVKAVELLGLGHAALRRLPSGPKGVDPAALRKAIAHDRARGITPLAIVGTAGSVDLGRFDDLNALADVAKDESVWLHIDGAFGAWTRLAEPSLRALSDGIERSDSLACDFHKWMYVPYDCGLVLIRSEATHRATFAARPAYLAGHEAGLGGGEPWFCDYGVDLSRGGRALKVWATIETYGADRLGQMITANCKAAALMQATVEQQDRMAMAEPVVSNICTFTADATLDDEAQSALNSRIAEALQLSGEAVFSTTTVGGRLVLRAAITNHRTTDADVTASVLAVRRMRDNIDTRS